MGTELVKVEDYPIARPNQEEMMKIISQNTGPHGFTMADLDRVKIPGAGGQAWELPGIGAEAEVAKSFDAIIIHFREARRLFNKSFEETGGATAPDCFSDDGFMGVGTPGGECDRCPNAQFGTDPKGGKGQACKQLRLLFCMRQGSVVPLVVTLPPTSLQPCRKYFLRLGAKGIPYWGVVTRIGLEKKASGNGIAYSAVTFSVVAELSPEQIASVTKVRESLMPALDRLRAEANDFKPESPS